MTEMAIFRVVQESLSNVLRHSSSKVVDIRLSRRPGTINLSVKDRRPGGAPARPIGIAHHAGVGISGMKERLKELGGWLDVRTMTGGMVVVASIPARASA
jgi:two-component system, NarL family, sensor kinase